MNMYPTVPLAQILSRSQIPVGICPEKTYKQVTVRLFHKGIVLRGEQSGSAIATPRQWRVRTGQVLLSRIDARNGAIGLVPPGLDGAIVTTDFWAFDVNSELAEPRFLDLYFGTRQFVEACQRASEGTTNRVRLQPNRFVEIQVPLPRLTDQRRIVARIEELFAKIEEVRALRRHASDGTHELSYAGVEAAYRRLHADYATYRLEDICVSITDGDHNTPTFTETGVRFIFVGNVSSGRLHFENSKRVNVDYFRTLKPQRLPERGDILYSAVGATLGIPAIVDSNEPFCFQRHVAILKPDCSKVSSQFLWHMLRSRTVFKKAWSSTTGSAQPTVPLRAIRELQIPLPALTVQCQIVTDLDNLQAKVDALKKLQEAAAAELNALMPSILSRAFSGQL
jgi:type I restriction enzyme S subunit